MERESNPIKPTINFEENNPEVVYADAVQLAFRNDMVALGFGVRDLKDSKSAKISHRVYMSFSSFLKFIETGKEGSEYFKKVLTDKLMKK